MPGIVQQTLSAASDIIDTDVRFEFEEEEEDGRMTVKEVRAHKFILALVSDVFRSGFYGGIPDNGSIKIKDVTKESFEAMIDFIYDKKPDVSISFYEWDILCSLYYLGDKYNIKILMEESLKAILSKEITAENVVNVGLLAEQNSVHEELAETLYDAAAKGLSKMFDGDYGDEVVVKVQQFFHELETTESPTSTSSFKSLVKIMARLRKLAICVCKNCRTTPCLNGKEITKENYVQGAAVSQLRGKSGKLVKNIHVSNPAQFYIMGVGTSYVYRCEIS